MATAIRRELRPSATTRLAAAFDPAAVLVAEAVGTGWSSSSAYLAKSP